MKIDVKENFIDKGIKIIAPVYAAKRLKARMNMAVANSFIGASKSRRQTESWSIKKGDADTLINYDLPELRARSMDLYRNSPYATGAIKTNCTNIIGPGLKLNPQIDRDVLNMTDNKADQWEAKTKQEFDLFGNSTECDIRRVSTFGEIQRLAFLSTLLKGDVFINMPFLKRVGSPYGLKLQLIDAERVSNPEHARDTKTISAGIEKNDNGEPIKYHILNMHPNSQLGGINKKKWQGVKVFGSQTGRRNIIHLFEPILPDQSRGIPYLSHVIEPFKQLDRYSEAELSAAVVSAMFTVFIKSELGEGLGVMQPTAETGGKASDKDFRMSSAAMLDLMPGEDVAFANPTRPNTAFDGFVQSILRQIGVALELPFELVVKHFTSSYSASRAALLEAWRFFSARRQWLSRKLCQPIYENWMEEAVSIGRISAPGFFNDPIIRAAYLGAVWIGPPKGMIDEKKETDADEKKIMIGEMTHSQVTAERTGGDWVKNIRQLKKENQLKDEAGFPIQNPASSQQKIAALEDSLNEIA